MSTHYTNIPVALDNNGGGGGGGSLITGSGSASQIAVFDGPSSVIGSVGLTFDSSNVNISGGIVAQKGGASFTVDVSSTTLAVISFNGSVMYGDANGINMGANLLVQGHLGVGNIVAGTTLGTVVRSMEIFDADNNSLGFIPVYDSIT